MNQQEIQINNIVIDYKIQLKARGIDKSTVTAYAEAINGGAEFDPVVVFDDGNKLWLADGFHRVDAYRFLGYDTIIAEVRRGTFDDAMVYAATANVTHGRPMSQIEKREAGERLLKLTNWSQSEIAKALSVTPAAVSKWASINKLIDREVKATRNGSAYAMDVSNIGKRTDPESEPVDNPPLFPQDENLEASLEDQESAFTCQECGEVMDLEKWHCPTCHGHWSLTTQTCPKCMPQVVEEVNGCKVVFGDARKLDLSQFGQYGVIVADPPWQYRVSKGQGTADDQYDTMTDEGLRAMPVADLAKPDSVLLMWGTWPKMPEALSLMNAWGFEYVTGFPWIKTTNGNNIDYGVGYWVRGVSEYVIIGKRGGVSVESLRIKGFMGLLAENGSNLTEMWLGGPNLQHSRKPDSVHQIAEALPGPYLELFARRPRHGWTVFGNDKELFQKTLA